MKMLSYDRVGSFGGGDRPMCAAVGDLLGRPVRIGLGAGGWVLSKSHPTDETQASAALLKGKADAGYVTLDSGRVVGGAAIREVLQCKRCEGFGFIGRDAAYERAVAAITKEQITRKRAAMVP